MSQPYILDMIAFFEPHIEAVLAEFVPDPAETLPGRVSCIDGTLLPCWSYEVTASCTPASTAPPATSSRSPATWTVRCGRSLIPIPDPGTTPTPTPKPRGPATSVTTGGIGDKGYVGTGLVTPKKKPRGGELSPRDKECNKEINGLRSVVEQAISHVKSWRIFHTDYRRPLHTFAQAFRTTRALYFFSTTF